jgi:hypothetical protein
VTDPRLDDVQFGARSSACEPFHVELREVERRLEPECELREVLAHDKPLLESMARKAGRVHEAHRLRRRPDRRVVIGAHLVEARDRVAHLELGEREQPSRRVRCEVVERLLAPSEEDLLAFAMEVKRGAEVDRERQPLRKLRRLLGHVHEPALGLDGQIEPRRRGELARPDACPEDDAVGSDPPAPEGGPLDLDNFRRRQWAPAVEASGVQTPATLYDLRDTFASNALAAGVTVFELARVMGTSVRMIEKQYGALLDGAHNVIANRLDAFEAEMEQATAADAEA